MYEEAQDPLWGYRTNRK